MGVPKFFRYTSERYPCLNELVKQYQIPDFDNMYLDMNGIIHNCSHPDDSNPHFRITEEKIFQDVFHYISILFQIIKPKKLFFMAIDGVAPRAKMNQQRGRRFRSAREAEELEEKARAKGEKLPSEKRFDSNCITPGTVFMARLHEQLRYFVKEKMSNDPMWSKVKVILSGHETPGEGEHKIMDYIRWARSQPDYDPNTRHCLYGLDADLIMLGMCTHEPHFALLREEVKFGKSTQRATSPEETNFYLLHLSLLREYLEQEFIAIKHKLPFEYDIEKIVDDWVLMGFLVGNDFIPNLPNMHISNDALPLLYQTYMTVLPTLDGYINEAGNLNLKRFETFMQELSNIDKQAFQDTYADLKYFEAKTGRRPNANERKEYKPNNDDTFNVNIDDIKANKPDDELQALINATHDMFMEDLHKEDDDDEDYEDIDSSDEEANFNMEFSLHKKDYYMNKLDYSKVTDEVLASQAECYVRAIQWNLHYYYRGCPSWCWYYPHHYAPYISDIRGFADLDIRFEKGEPFKPFEQLLAVLPAASKHLLPTPFHDLMTDEDSPIVHYYPVHFETDLNGKKNDWEAVVLIPFIDEVNLLSAMEPCYQRLTDEERKRNTHGPMLLYSYTPNNEGPVNAPAYFPTIPECHAIEKFVWREELEVPEHQLKRGMLPNANTHLVYPGFPTMRHLKYKTSIKKKRVKVFDQPSRNDNMIVEIVREVVEDPQIHTVADQLLGKVIWVGWPHLAKAKVVSVSNEELRLHSANKDEEQTNGHVDYNVERNLGNLHKQWISERATVIEHNMNRLGIELGDVHTLIHAVSLKGYKYKMLDNCKMSMEPVWCAVPCGYAYQAVVTDVAGPDGDGECLYHTGAEAYPARDRVFLLTQGQYYGCQAQVLESESIRSGRIKVSVIETPEPVPSIASQTPPYRSSNHAAAACGISSQLLSRVTGSILVVMGQSNNEPTEQKPKVNVGLNLKFNKKNQEVTGYTRRCSMTNTWLYSDRCVELVSNYAQRYPELFDYLSRFVNKDIFFESDLWPGEVGKEKPKEVAAWLKSQPHFSAPKRECGSEVLEPEELVILAKNIDTQLANITYTEKKVTLHVKWNLLYKPELHEGNIQPDPKADFKMFDRIVCVAKNITVPYGAKGTITGVFAAGHMNTVRLSDRLNADTSYQVLLDTPLSADSTDVQDRTYRMLPANMLSISFGRKLRDLQTSHVQTEYTTLTHSPNVLKRDTQPSAFAPYSPTKDTSPVSDNRYALDVRTYDTEKKPTQDPGTELLKNLLKISQNDSDTPKSNKKTPENNKNWRMKPEKSVPTSAPPPRIQQQQTNNWRSENKETFTQPPQPSGEWTNRTHKGQGGVPAAMFPAWVGAGGAPVYQPRHSAPPPHLFPPGHVYMQHHQNQPHWGAQNNMKPDQQMQYNQQQTNPHQQNLRQIMQPQNMPKMHNTPQIPHMSQTMPNVLQNMQHIPHSLPQGPQMQRPMQNIPHTTQNQQHYSHQQSQALASIIKPNAACEKLSNPFVPLQVQVRRAPNQPGCSTQSKVTSQPPAQTDGTQQQNDANAQPAEQRTQRQRRKKGRIAANLPFMD